MTHPILFAEDYLDFDPGEADAEVRSALPYDDLPFTDEPFPSEMADESPAPEHRYQLGERLIATQFNVPRVVEVIGLPADPRQLYKVQGLSSSFTWYCPVEHLHPYWPKESTLDVIKKIIEWGFELRISTLSSGAKWVQVSIPFEVSIAISGGTLEELLPLVLERAITHKNKTA